MLKAALGTFAAVVMGLVFVVYGVLILIDLDRFERLYRLVHRGGADVHDVRKSLEGREGLVFGVLSILFGIGVLLQVPGILGAR